MVYVVHAILKCAMELRGNHLLRRPTVRHSWLLLLQLVLAGLISGCVAGNGDNTHKIGSGELVTNLATLRPLADHTLQTQLEW